MNDFVLYCKSYANDFLRLKRLLTSIQQYNINHIPFYISTPSKDREALERILGEDTSYIWVADEDIVRANPNASFEKYRAMPGGLSQAIIKSEFWRLQLAENYLCLDSDCVFIRPFSKSDFMAADGTPYTVLHQNKEYFQLALNRGKSKIPVDLQAESERVRTLFDRAGPLFYGAPAPFIWSSKVWQALDGQYLLPKGITLWELVDRSHPETLIYIEALLKFRAIPVIAVEHLFKVYHYDWQYYLSKRLGETEEKLKQNYLGVIYQSTWQSELNLGGSQKSYLSLGLKKAKRFLRYLQSFI